MTRPANIKFSGIVAAAQVNVTVTVPREKKKKKMRVHFRHGGRDCDTIAGEKSTLCNSSAIIPLESHSIAAAFSVVGR